MKTATLKIFPNVRKVSKKDNSIPVYFRVIVDCIKAEGKIPDVSLTENFQTVSKKKTKIKWYIFLK